MTATFDNAAKALAALDFSKEQEAVSQLMAESAKISEAIERANHRLGEIGFILNSRSPDSEGGRAVAEALLAGTEPGEAAALASASREALLIERANLNAGLADLRKRDIAFASKLRDVQEKARARLAGPLKPVIAEVVADAKAAAQTIAKAYATLEAISLATRQGTAEARKLASPVANLTGAGIAEPVQRLAVPDSLTELLAPLAKVGEALPVHVPQSVIMPDDLASMAIAYGVEARRAVG